MCDAAAAGGTICSCRRLGGLWEWPPADVAVLRRVDSRACRVYRDGTQRTCGIGPCGNSPTVCFLTEEARSSSKDESGNRVSEV